MRHNFQACLDFMLDLEGGYQLHHNSGEATHTYAGIYRAAHPTWLGWEYITAGEPVPECLVLEFYEVEFWDKISGDELPNGLDLMLFCMAVNSGVHNASVLLQKVLGSFPDGIIGSKTLALANMYTLQNTTETVVSEKLMDFTVECLYYYDAVVEHNPDKDINLAGWRNRLVKVDREAIKRVVPF